MWEQLLSAINKNNVIESERLIKSMNLSDFNKEYCKLWYNQIPIHLAAERGNDKIVAQLLSVMPELISITDLSGRTALHSAARSGNDKIVAQLLSVMPELALITDSSSITALHLAARNGNEKIVAQLLSVVPKLALTIDSSGRTALHYAVFAMNEKIVAQLLSVMPELTSIIDKDGETALHYAARNGNDKIVAQLLSIMPELALTTDSSGRTALHYAVLAMNDKIVTQLLSIMPELVSIIDKDGRTALHLVAYEGSESILTKVLSIMPGLALIVDKDGYTALHIAAGRGNEPVATKLLSIVPDLIDVVDEDGRTALHIAARSGSEQIVDQILHAKPKLALITDKKGQIASELTKNYVIKTKIMKVYKVEKSREKSMIEFKTELEKIILEKNNIEKNSKLYQAEIVKLYREKVALKVKIKNIEKIIKEKDNLEYNLKVNAKLYEHEKKALVNQIEVLKIGFIEKENKSNIIEKLEKGNEKIITTHKAQQAAYSNEKINKLLDILKDNNVISNVADLEQKKLSVDKIEELIRPVIKNGKTVVIALHLHGHSWAGLMIKKQVDDSLKILYNDPRGIPFIKEKNVKSLINNIINLEDETSVIDLRHVQQIVDNDSAPFVIDNLINLAKIDDNSMKKSTLQKLLSAQDQINNIKQNHLIVEDNNPWYSDCKIDKLLHLKLDSLRKYDSKEKQIITPIVEFERKELLIENVIEATQEVMDNNKIAMMPIHIHGNHWTALVIKKQADGSLQLLYNDPKGNSLMNEKNSGVLIRAISKINSEFTMIDIQLKQQNNDDDCGPYTVENLFKLATSNTSDMHKQELQRLLQTDNIDIHAIRRQHIHELNKAGIPINTSLLSPDNSNMIYVIDTTFEDINESNTSTKLLSTTPISENQEMDILGIAI